MYEHLLQNVNSSVIEISVINKPENQTAGQIGKILFVRKPSWHSVLLRGSYNTLSQPTTTA